MLAKPKVAIGLVTVNQSNRIANLVSYSLDTNQVSMIKEVPFNEDNEYYEYE